MKTKMGKGFKKPLPMFLLNDMKITTGRILSAHGIRGEVSVKPLTDNPARFQKGNQLYIEKAGRYEAITGLRGGKDDLLILSFEGVRDRDQAEKLKGSLLQIEAEEARSLPAGEYYFFQLKGMDVVEEDGTPLGTLVELIESGANDVYRIDCGNGDFLLIPALKQIVKNIDLAQKKMTVALLPGLKEACTTHEN